MPILLRYFFIVLLALGGGAALAQDKPNPDAATDTTTPAIDPAKALVQLRTRLDTIKASVDSKKTDTPITDLRNGALAIQQQAEQLTATLSPQSASLQTRLDVLGPVPIKGAHAESAELSTQRRQLDKTKGELDNQITQAKSLGTEAAQLAAHVAELRRDQFQAQLASRTSTPFSMAFWADPAKTFPDDAAHAKELGDDVLGAMQQAWQPPNRTPLILCLIVAVLLLSAGRWLVEHTLVRVTTDRMPAGRLRRSALAVALSLAYTLSIGLAAHFAYLALNWNDILNEDLNDLAQRIERMVTFAAFMTGLGRAMLANERPSWRLPALSDDAAKRLRLYPWLMGAAALLLGLLESVNNAIGASLPATVTTRGIVALLIGLLMSSALLRLGQSRRAALAAGETLPHRPVWSGLIIAAAFISVAIVLLSVSLGYIAFGFFMARQILWVGVILTSLYLLMHLADDICDSVFAPKGNTGTRIQSGFGLSPSALEQTGTVLSGISRALLVIFALTLAFAPVAHDSGVGAGPQELAERIGRLLSGGSLGKLNIVPGNILNAILMLVVGMVVLRVIKRWLSDQLLPKTSFDLGMQNSMLTLLGYVGGVIVFVLALVTLNVDLQSIAWMASALSVGIGFGLQAIVQNFISGLILLAERPVKVGDWVSIGGVEGDIRRINVRATEIQMGDRSTMIVPNSQFITQNVRNVTLANAQGRVQIKLPMPVDTDAGKAREIILEVLCAHPSTLGSPIPTVQLENIDAGAMSFSCIAYVTSPRDAGNVKSDLLFEMLERLRQAKLPMTSPQSMVLRTLPAAVTDSSDDKD